MSQSLTVSNEPGATNPTNEELQTLVASDEQALKLRGDEQPEEEREDEFENDEHVLMQYFVVPSFEGDQAISDYYQQFASQIAKNLPSGSQKDACLQHLIESMYAALRARHGSEVFDYEVTGYGDFSEDDDEEI